MFTDTFSVELSPECVALFKSNRKAFTKTLREELLGHKATLESMLRPFCDGIREEFSNDSICIEECNIEVDELGKGRVYIEWQGYVEMGCRDISGPTDHEGWFKFTIDLDEGVLEFHVDYPPEREPDEF
jgi:hypothetical protein